MVLQFAPDGAVRASLRSRAAVQYQFLSSEGDSYHLAFSSGDDTVEQTVDVTGDEMVLHQPNQEAARTLVRVPNSPVGDPPFVGRWVSGEQGSPEIVLLEYTADGHLLFDLPVRTLLGTYTVEGEQILIAWSSKGGSTDKVQLRWAGDELWGKDAAGEEHRAFQRFVPSSDPGPSRVEPSTEPD